MTASPGDELVEHLDSDGNVIGIASRREMRERKLRHRCTYVVVTTPDDKVVVHQRAAWKDIAPLYWDVAFGGVCDVGEEWSTAAARELAEEAGITDVALTDLGPVRWKDAIIGRLYHVVTDQVPTCPDGEVVAVDTIAFEDMAEWIEGRDITLDTLDIVVPLLLQGPEGLCPDTPRPGAP